MSTTSQKRVLDAALRVFARYGYRRTSMADVAEEAGMSRPALYQWFANKGALFQALAKGIKDDALANAEAAWTDGMSIEEGLFAAILAKDLPLLRLLHASPHGAELMAVDTELTAAMAKELQDGFVAILAGKISGLAVNGSINLAAFGTAVDFGTIVCELAGGLKHEAPSEPRYVESVRRFCQIVAAALRPASP